MDLVLNILGEWPPALIYLIAALLVASETGTILGLLVPAEATLLLVGFLCYAGNLHLAVALPVMLGAGLLGDSLGYLEGRRVGPRLRTGRLGRRVGERRWAKAERLLHRHGGGAVFLARFIAFARTLTPRLAGISQLGYQTFLPWDVAGVFGCVGGTVLAGYAAGRSYVTVAEVFGRATGALFWLVLVIVGLVVVGQYLGRHPDPVAALGNRLAGWPPLRFVGWAYRTGFHWLVERIGVGGAVAVNVLGGVVALFAVGYALTWAVDSLVSDSGLPLVDAPILRWAGAQRAPSAVQAAEVTLSILRGTYLVILVGLVAAVLNWRSPVWRADLLGVLGTGGAFVPLVLIALAADWERGPGTTPPIAPFGNQNAVVAASVGILAWLLSRRFGWGAAVAAWTAAVTTIVVVGAARIYLGWSLPSEAVASTLLGGLWVLIFVVAWHTRDRVRAAGISQAPGLSVGASDAGPAE